MLFLRNFSKKNIFWKISLEKQINFILNEIMTVVMIIKRRNNLFHRKSIESDIDYMKAQQITWITAKYVNALNYYQTNKYQGIVPT